MANPNKYVMINNKTTDCDLTLYIYPSWDLVCLVSSLSKIILPGAKYIHSSKSYYKFEIAGKRIGRKSTIKPAGLWTKDMYISVNETLDVEEDDMANHRDEKRICLRKLNMEKEVGSMIGRNLYEILRLSPNDVRKLCADEQDRIIKSAYRKEIRRWHPDVADNGGDGHVAWMVVSANRELIDRERRADHHNEIDYDAGWLSWRRWKAIFWSECASSEQRWRYWKRVGLMFLSVLCIGGGTAIIALTGGLAASAVIAGGICGGALLGGGMQSIFRTIRRDTVINGCSCKDYFKSFAFGLLAGLVAGGAAVGIAAGIVGIGANALEAASITFAQYIGVTTPSAAIAGIAYALANDAEREFVDGDDVTFAQVIGHAFVGRMIGGACGAGIGAVGASLAGLSAEEAAINVGGKASQTVPGAKRIGVAFVKRLCTGLTDKGTSSVLGPVADFVEERVDDSRENRPVSTHLGDAGKQFLSEIVREVGAGVAGETASHTWNEISVRRNISTQFVDEPDQYGDMSPAKRQQTRRETRYKLDEENNTKRFQLKNCRADRVRYQPLLQGEHVVEENVFERPVDTVNISQDTVEGGRIRYLSKGPWVSKMLVRYQVNEQNQCKEVQGSGASVTIPAAASDVEVGFKVLRSPFVWCDVKRWDRFQNIWMRGPHIFRYNLPPTQRTFTIGGPLYQEAVLCVTDELYDMVNDM